MPKLNHKIINLWMQAAEVFREYGHEEVANHIIESVNYGLIEDALYMRTGMGNPQANNICSAFAWSRTGIESYFGDAYTASESLNSSVRQILGQIRDNNLPLTEDES
jgi:hypothetical protein